MEDLRKIENLKLRDTHRFNEWVNECLINKSTTEKNEGQSYIANNIVELWDAVEISKEKYVIRFTIETLEENWRYTIFAPINTVNLLSLPIRNGVVYTYFDIVPVGEKYVYDFTFRKDIEIDGKSKFISFSVPRKEDESVMTLYTDAE